MISFGRQSRAALFLTLAGAVSCSVKEDRSVCPCYVTLDFAPAAEADLGDADIDQKISFDYNVGTKLSDVQATPSFFIGGELIDITNVSGEEAFLEVLRSALDRNLEAAGLATGPNATADSATEADSETTANNTESTETQD